MIKALAAKSRVQTSSSESPKLGLRMKTQIKRKNVDNLSTKGAKSYLSPDFRMSEKVPTSNSAVASPRNIKAVVPDVAKAGYFGTRTNRIHNPKLKSTNEKKKLDQTFTVTKVQVNKKLSSKSQNKKQSEVAVNLSRKVFDKSSVKAQNNSPSFSDKIENEFKQLTKDLVVQNEKRTMLETEVSKLVDYISRKDAQIVILKQENLELLSSLQNHKLIIDNLQIQLKQIDMDKVDLIKMNEQIDRLEREKLLLEEDVDDYKERIESLNSDVRKLSEVNIEKEISEVKESSLEEETAEFLEKVSSLCKEKSIKIKALSKDKNVKINLKITVRKDKLDNGKPSRHFNLPEAFHTPNVMGTTPCQTFSIQEDYGSPVPYPKTLSQAKGDFEDEVFYEDVCLPIKSKVNTSDSPATRQGASFPEVLSTPVAEQVSTKGLNTENANISIDKRTEELDIKMSELWTRLDSQDEATNKLNSEKEEFTNILDQMKVELSESKSKHCRLQGQVQAEDAKILFC